MCYIGLVTPFDNELVQVTMVVYCVLTKYEYRKSTFSMTDIK